MSRWLASQSEDMQKKGCQDDAKNTYFDSPNVHLLQRLGATPKKRDKQSIIGQRWVRDKGSDSQS